LTDNKQTSDEDLKTLYKVFSYMLKHAYDKVDTVGYEEIVETTNDFEKIIERQNK